MTLVRRVNGIDTNITEVMEVNSGVVNTIGSIIQVDNGVLTTRFGSNAIDFAINDAGIDFEVSRPGLVSLSLTTGAFSGTNYVNGQSLGTVTVDTTRTLTGSITVPNNAMWSNAGEDITITGISTTQLGPFVPPPAEVRNTYDYTFYDTVSPFNIVSDGTAVEEDCTNNLTDTFIHVKSCFTRTTVSGNTPRYTTTCTAAGGCDDPDGTIVNFGPVETGTTEVEVCGECTATDNSNPNYIPIFSLTDVAPSLSVRIVPSSGEVVAISNDDAYAVSLAAGQKTSYDVLPYGYTNADGDGFEIRNISVVVTGEIPPDYQNEGDDFTLTGEIAATQRPAALLPPVISATIGYQNTSSVFVNLYPTNGSITSITDFPTGGQYIVFGESTNDGAVTGDRGFYGGSTTGRKHILTATNALGAADADTITFTVRTNTI